MSTMLNRVIEVIVGNRRITFPELHIEFGVKFDTSGIPNEIKCQIYNLNDDSIASIQRGQNIVINAGYKGDIGSICEGVVTNVELMTAGVDRYLEITALNTTEDYLNMKVNKSYAENTEATFIMADLASLLGIKFDILSVKEEVVYPRGYYANGAFKDVISDLVDDCNSLFIVTGGSLTVIPGWSGFTYGFAMSSDNGLISLEEIDETDTPYKYKLKCLLTHGIQPYTFLDLDSVKVHGRMLVGEGKHTANGNDFITECKLIPI